MYNRMFPGGTVKICLLTVAMLSMANFVCASPDELEDNYAKLKDAVAKKDAAGVKAAAPATYKSAQALVNAPKPADAEEAKNWAARVEYGKEVEAYTEYALASTAEQGIAPAETVSLIDMLLAQNPKSKYVDELCANAYLVALGKSGGTAKQMEGMSRIAAGHPDNIVALTALLEGRHGSQLQNANRLIAAAKKPKPEGIAEADWEKTRNAALGNGYYYAGFIAGQQRSWMDCEKNLKSALPLISTDQTKLGTAYFSLGICEYQFGRQIADRTKMVDGQKYMERAAAIKGPYQSQAYTQNLAMKNELSGRK